MLLAANLVSRVTMFCAPQAKGLINGFTAATLMFSPAALVQPSFADDAMADSNVKLTDFAAPSLFPGNIALADGEDAQVAEAPKPKKKKAKKAEAAPDAAAPAPAAEKAADAQVAEAPKPKKKKAKKAPAPDAAAPAPDAEKTSGQVALK
jgi:outer membrane biosynthesis protein TonB